MSSWKQCTALEYAIEEDRQLLNSSLYIFGSKLVGYAIRLVLPFFLIRLLSVSDFGAYRQFFLLESYIGALFQLGLNQALYYLIPRDLQNAGSYFLNSVLMNVLVFAIAFSLSLIHI